MWCVTFLGLSGGRTSLDIICINHLLLLGVEQQHQGAAADHSVTSFQLIAHALILAFVLNDECK